MIHINSVINLDIKTREEELEAIVKKAKWECDADLIRKRYCLSPEDVRNWDQIHENHLESYVQARIELDRIQRRK